MPRTCERFHPDPAAAADRCRICFLYVTRPDIRAKWDGRIPHPAARQPCPHLGPPTGERRPKLNCAADPPVTVPVLACALHVLCTEDTSARLTPCCRYCGDRP